MTSPRDYTCERMHLTSKAEEEEELLIHRAMAAYQTMNMPAVRPPSLQLMQNPLLLQMSKEDSSLLANTPLKSSMQNSAITPPTLRKIQVSASSSDMSTSSLQVDNRKKTTVKRHSVGSLKVDPFALARHAPSNKSFTTKSVANNKVLRKSISPTGSGSKLSRSFSGGKHRYSDSYLSAGLHSRKSGVRHIAGDKNENKNATWEHQNEGQTMLTSFVRNTIVASGVTTLHAAATTTMSPLQFLKSTLESHGHDATVQPSLTANDFFLENSDEHVASYAQDIVTAVRSQDIPMLRCLRAEGRTLQCCNRFGESLIHMACRRGFLDVVRFLLGAEGGNVSICVRDDYGRTPLHDACWAPKPNFELMNLLLDWCSSSKQSLQEGNEGVAQRLLLMSDKRGHTPLDYVRREHWGQWIEFLGKRFGATVEKPSTSGTEE